VGAGSLSQRLQQLRRRQTQHPRQTALRLTLLLLLLLLLLLMMMLLLLLLRWGRRLRSACVR
jgi:hypothetical protein